MSVQGLYLEKGLFWWVYIQVGLCQGGLKNEMDFLLEPNKVIFLTSKHLILKTSKLIKSNHIYSCSFSRLDGLLWSWNSYASSADRMSQSSSPSIFRSAFSCKRNTTLLKASIYHVFVFWHFGPSCADPLCDENSSSEKQLLSLRYI